ncbi:hypothetical protein F0562_013751 [Nyssa sinensis]|uniref:Uncharacterized protein n=1 Tax=Nyssa sinensis TaxID=561372 RepID=A0A5J4ZLL3_9ASTE|nr:hypothetical protein F0562_013751 [Nyssa sinensis]
MGTALGGVQLSDQERLNDDVAAVVDGFYEVYGSMTAEMVMSPGMESGSSNNGNFRDAWVELKWRCEAESKRDGNAVERELQQQWCGSSGAAAPAAELGTDLNG